MMVDQGAKVSGEVHIDVSEIRLVSSIISQPGAVIEVRAGDIPLPVQHAITEAFQRRDASGKKQERVPCGK